MTLEDVNAASRLVAFGMGRRHRPTGTNEYTRLLERFRLEPDFADHVRAIARGFDLDVIAAEIPAGLVLGTTEETEFKVAVSKLAAQRDDRPVYLLAHLLIAAEAFPRPHDLDDDSFIGRVSVNSLDTRVREAITILDRKATEQGASVEPPADQPGLEAMWRHYHRRPNKGTTAKNNDTRTNTRSLISRALKHLKDHGMVTFSSDEAGGTYTTTARYRLQVRELAGYELLEDLAALGIALPANPLADAANNGGMWSD